MYYPILPPRNGTAREKLIQNLMVNLREEFKVLHKALIDLCGLQVVSLFVYETPIQVVEKIEQSPDLETF